MGNQIKEKEKSFVEPGEVYWKVMYEELETQLKQMMIMSLDLIDSEVALKEKELNTKRKSEVNKKNQEIKELQNKINSYKKQINTFKKQANAYKKQIMSLDKQNRNHSLFQHRIKVTWLGKFTIKYIDLKKMIKKLIIKKP